MLDGDRIEPGRSRYAQEVLNRTACPVVLVGPDCSPLALTETERRTEAALVLCFDGSPASEATVPLAREWAGALGLVAHVVAVTHHDGSRVGDRDAAPVRARALQLVDELRAQGIDARAAFPDCADAAHGLGRYVDEQPAALVVTAARRQDGIAHAVLGPVALRLVRHAAVPVLVAERHR